LCTQQNNTSKHILKFLFTCIFFLVFHSISALEILFFPFKSHNLLNIINNDNSDSINILITIIKDNTLVLNCAHITLTRGDHITRKDDIFFQHVVTLLA
jgi:hypothetical protein